MVAFVKTNIIGAIMNNVDPYEVALMEIKVKRVNAALWARALAFSDGDNNKAISQYIRLRAEQIETTDTYEQQAQQLSKNDEYLNPMSSSSVTDEDYEAALKYAKQVYFKEKIRYWKIIATWSIVFFISGTLMATFRSLESHEAYTFFKITSYAIAIILGFMAFPIGKRKRYLDAELHYKELSDPYGKQNYKKNGVKQSLPECHKQVMRGLQMNHSEVILKKQMISNFFSLKMTKHSWAILSDIAIGFFIYPFFGISVFFIIDRFSNTLARVGIVCFSISILIWVINKDSKRIKKNDAFFLEKVTMTIKWFMLIITSICYGIVITGVEKI